MISTVRIVTEGPFYDLLWHIDQMVETSTGIEDGAGRKTLVPIRVNLAKVTDTEWHGTVAAQFNYSQVGNYSVGVTKDDIDLLKRDDEVTKSRFTVDVVLKDGAQYSQLRSALGDKLIEVPAKCDVTYLKLGSSHLFSFPCIGLLRDRRTAIAKP